MSKYVDIKIPEDHARKIDNFIKTSENGFRSRAEFIVYLIRLYFEKADIRDDE